MKKAIYRSSLSLNQHRILKLRRKIASQMGWKNIQYINGGLMGEAPYSFKNKVSCNWRQNVPSYAKEINRK